MSAFKEKIQAYFIHYIISLSWINDKLNEIMFTLLFLKIDASEKSLLRYFGLLLISLRSTLRMLCRFGDVLMLSINFWWFLLSFFKVGRLFGEKTL